MLSQLARLRQDAVGFKVQKATGLKKLPALGIDFPG
jgi:hypothetical protein